MYSVGTNHSIFNIGSPEMKLEEDEPLDITSTENFTYHPLQHVLELVQLSMVFSQPICCPPITAGTFLTPVRTVHISLSYEKLQQIENVWYAY